MLSVSTIAKPSLENLGKFIFAMPWLVFGIQHFMYAGFLENLVPAYMPYRIFWVYLAGVGMFAAGVSLLINVKSPLAALCLGIMLACFILQLHVPLIYSDLSNNQNWMRGIQDLSIASVAFMLSGHVQLRKAMSYIYVVTIFIFGVYHFFGFKFITAKAPDYLPYTFLWDYFLGILLCVSSVAWLLNQHIKIAAMVIGCSLLVLVLLQLPVLFTDIKNPLKWVVIMLELCIASGAFVLIRFQNSFNPKSA